MAIVQDYTITSLSNIPTVVSYLENNWIWSGGKTTSGDISGIYEAWLWMDVGKTIGVYFYARPGVSAFKIGIKFKGTNYHLAELSYSTITFKIEITSDMLCISYIDAASITATNCSKIMVCDAHNSVNNSDEQVMIWLGSKSTSNVCAMYASDVVTPYDLPAQDANTGINAKISYMIPFYNKASAFVTTGALQALTMDVASWYFGNISLNNKPYRMSGSVFMPDES